MNRKIFFAVLMVVASVLSAAGGGYYFITKKNLFGLEPGAKTERKILYWTDPMIPGYRSDKPGKSPMNMDLVPIYEEGGATASGAAVVTIQPEILHNLGVRTYKVVRGDAPRRLAAQGYLYREKGRWLALLDIFDRNTTWVRAGLSAEIHVAELPNQTWDGVVEDVEADVGIGARSFKVRVRVNKPDATLHPNMYADVLIKGAPRRDQEIMVPREALIRTGRRTAVVLALEGGRFQPVEVTPGEESGDWIALRQGVKEGDTVVVSGQFMIDSEASVRASFQRMDAKPAEAGTASEEKKP